MKHTDPLSEVLMLLNPRAAFSSSLETGGDWAIQFNGYASVKFCAVTRGSCWLNADSLDEPIRLNFGDCFLLSDGTPYLLASDLCISPDHASKVFENAVDGYTRWGNGNDVVIIGGRFDFEGEDAFLLLDTLPAVIHIASNSPHSNVIQWVLNQLSLELSVSSIGSSLMADNLAHILIVQVLRSFLGSKNKPPTGWLNALADPKINIALCLIHQDPARHWRLDDFTTATGMSRSSFASRFKTLVGVPPLDYLLRWRMLLAARKLKFGADRISDVAFSLGYEAESSFSNAFKRVMGCAPYHYRKFSSPTNQFINSSELELRRR